MTGPLVRRLAASSMSRFPSIKPKQSGVVLVPGHSAEVEGRTLFPTTVNAVDDPRVKRLLKSGHNSRKIGRRVEKGRLTMAPIFTLTLEERKTCPRNCKTWRSCYGNGTPYAQRLVHGPQFEATLWAELADLQRKHPRGFLVRLHVLGDFYSVEYVDLWAEALVAFPALNVFGFTARNPVSDPTVTLSNRGVVKTQRLHVVILTAFCGPPPFPGAHAAHNDGDTGNCALANLRWATPVENQADVDRHGHRCRGEAVFGAKLTESDVRSIRTHIAAGFLNPQIAGKFGVSPSTIHLIRHNKIWRHVA